MLRFVSEFGAQALPVDAEVAAACEADKFPQFARKTLSDNFGAQLDLLERLSPLSNCESWSEWVLQTQERQAEIVRHTIEILRTLIGLRVASANFCLPTPCHMSVVHFSITFGDLKRPGTR